MTIYSDLVANMTGTTRNAFDILYDLFNSYGLGTLAPKISSYIQQGLSGDSISLLLKESPEYKARFAGNDARSKAGLSVLTPAEYLATERAYRQVLSSAGMPKGFYDSPSDFTKWIGGDTSPNEVQQRVDKAVEFTTDTDPASRQALQNLYGVDVNHIVAWALNPSRALPIMEKQARAVEAAGAAYQQGLSVNKGQAESIADYTNGMSQGQVQQNFGNVAELVDRGSLLASTQKTTYTAQDAIDEVFKSSSDAKQKRIGLASQERAAFSGTNGIGKSSLGNDTQV